MGDFDVNKFIDDIKKNLETLNGKNLEGNKNWTIAIKKKLIDIAVKYELSVNCKIGKKLNKHHENKEWLYDAIIYSNKTDIFDEVYLVCESEWENKLEGIEWDFKKMILARSKVRLLIYQVSKEEFNKFLNRFLKIIEESNTCIIGDIYLFAIYINMPDGNDIFEVKKYIKTGKKLDNSTFVN